MSTLWSWPDPLSPGSSVACRASKDKVLPEGLTGSTGIPARRFTGQLGLRQHLRKSNCKSHYTAGLQAHDFNTMHPDLFI